jgi:phosphatidate cytidylyltransferase
MNDRLLVAIILLPIGAVFIAMGGVPYALVVAIILSLAAWEYNRLFRLGKYQPAVAILIGGALAFTITRYFFDFRYAAALLSTFSLAAMTFHLIAYELGRDQAAADFAITVGGLIYIGWIGAYLISLRLLPDGKWWVLTVLPCVWLGDAGAMLVGLRWGKHLMAPRLSPKKTWEGFAGGVVSSTLSGALIGALWGLVTPALTPGRGALLGLALGVLTPLGDLGESMIKRQFGEKDSSHLLPGHGGVFDRIDSWLWAAVIGYYMIVALW